MSNICHITKDDKEIATIHNSMGSFAVAMKIITKYIPLFNAYEALSENTIDKQLKVVYDNCTEAEKIVIMFFILLSERTPTLVVRDESDSSERSEDIK